MLYHRDRSPWNRDTVRSFPKRVLWSHIETTNVRPNVTLPADLADGEYKVILAGREMEAEGAPFIPAETFYGVPNYG